ncbi:MAG: aquaporin [Gemmatimonadaceae bacterium]
MISAHDLGGSVPHTPVPAPRRYATEFIATAILVIVGCGASILGNASGAFGMGPIACAFGGVVALLVVSFGATSGAHINPAVTIAFWSVRQFPPRDVIPYIVAQCTGAVFGAFLLRVYFGLDAHFAATLPTVSTAAAFAMELGYSFVLALVVAVVSSRKTLSLKIPPIAIGFTVLIGAYLTGPLSGGSFNPARSLGPAVVSGVWVNHWIFWVAPIVGMLCAMQLHHRLWPVQSQLAIDIVAKGVEGPL